MNNLYLIKSGDNGFVEETSAVISAEGGDISINSSFYVDSAGNIGIGSSDPTNKLDVVGSANISSDLTVDNIIFTNVGGQSPAAANDIIKYDGNSWVVAAASTLPGGGGGAGNSDVPAGLINTLTQGESIHEINFGFDSNNDRIVYDNVPKIAASLEIDGAGEIIPHTVSGVSESGYFVVFSEELPTANYRMHTVFGGTDAFWETGVANLEYSERNVEIDRSLYVGQKVGIGTTNPEETLHVSSSDGPLVAILEHTDGGSSEIAFQDTNQQDQVRIGTADAGFRVYTADTERIRIDSDGNVGIGTTSPSSKLHIIGGNSYQEGITLSGRKDDGTSLTTLRLYHDDDNNAHIGRGSAKSISISSGGNVGIGTTNPTSPLHVKTSGTGATLVIESDDDGSSNAPDFLLFRSSTTPAVNDNLGEIKFRGKNDADPQSNIDYTMIRSRIKDPTNNSEKGELTFWTRGGATINQRMVLDSSGNVGIGTTNPQQKLEIAANNNGDTKSNYIRITDTDTTATLGTHNGGIEFYSNDASGQPGLTAAMEIVYSGSGGGGEIAFSTSGNSGGSLSEVMRLDNVGNVGIGTTNPNQKLHVEGVFRSSVTNEPDAYSQLTWGGGLSRDNGGTGNIITTQPAFIMNRIDQDGNSDRTVTIHSDNVSYFNGGNVGIGTKNPVKTLEMHIDDDTEYVSGVTGNSLRIRNMKSDTDKTFACIELFAGVSSGGNSPISRIYSVREGDTDGKCSLVFATRASSTISERMRINSTGDMLIGTQRNDLHTATSSDTDKDGLNYKAGSLNYLSLARSNTGAAFFINKSAQDASTATNYMVFKNSATTTGEIEYDGADLVITQASDKRLKTNIKDSESGLNIVNGLQVRSFDWVDNARKSKKFGFVAQEMHEVFEDAVRVGGEDPQEDSWAISESKLIPVLTKAIQEQQQMIENLKIEIEQLKS